ncbi:MAG: type IV pilin protein, partial [Caldisericia bacterium]
MKKLFGKKGFTLVEIVIVIVLLAILAAIAYPKYIDLRDDAHKATDQAIIGSWRSGVHI